MIDLRGKALDWFVSRDQLISNGKASPLATFGAYAQALQDAVRPVDLTDTYLEPFFGMRQVKRSMREFVAYFTSCRAKAPEYTSEAMFMYTFKRGYKDDLRRAITVQRLTTLEGFSHLRFLTYALVDPLRGEAKRVLCLTPNPHLRHLLMGPRSLPAPHARKVDIPLTPAISCIHN
jgi:hypothetical protein